MRGPLAGVRVVDFTIFQNGPSATARMLDEGAEVVKVEPFGGDGIRHVAPKGKVNHGLEVYNHGKKSLALDLKHPDAAGVVERLVRWADVLTENFRPGVMDKLGFSYERCREWNPRIIYASTSGYGPVGELAHRPSYDSVSQAYTGVAAVMGGGVSHPPLMVEWQFSDEVGAQHFYGAVVAALFARERSGRGQRLQTSQTAATIQFQRAKLQGTVHNGKQRDSGSPGGVGGQFYKAGDGRYLLVALTAPKDVAAFYTTVCERPDLLARRKKHRDAESRAQIIRETAAVIATRPAAEWDRRCGAAGVPGSMVNGYMDIAASQHLRDNGYVRDITHREWGRMTIAGAPTVFSDTPLDNSAELHAPRVGEHTDECLALAGCGAAEIARLGAAGAVRQHPPVQVAPRRAKPRL